MRTTATVAVALLAAALAAGCATPRDPNCPADARELPLQALYGQWDARFDDLPGTAVVQLGKHPEYAGVRGTITRRADSAATKTTVAQLAGDVDDEGALSIDESLDGRAISGVWSGTLQPGACGREFRGTWRDAATERTHPFVLRKTVAQEGKP
ncbi:hypothetical protein ACFJIS_05805 [Variovorax boronicumulans]|uniref:hypothetical protein n=1 Tax=Variovorax TaxID=34072 RepID=UPI000784A595|nr:MULTISPECIES: hypothetical protein [Variovorax]MDP9913541.1 hypothetical protein [Variovorax boronicumulans]PBI86939.1 hypothetical protein BKP43_41250 [Variovorax boronicumulans]TSD55185.1 hypothetical protein FFI97_028010 [Variovorax sp. KBS0712]